MSKRHISILLGEAFSFAASGLAFAADIAVKAPPPPPAEVPLWTGFYIGGNAGYGWGVNTSNTLFNTDPTDLGLTALLNATGPAFLDLKPKGFIGGGQIGYDWQVSFWVFGVVADFQVADITASRSATVTSPGGVPALTTTGALSEKLDFLGTVRARAGFAVGNWLFYGSGGYAYGNVQSSLNVAVPGFPFFSSGNLTENRSGWAAGGGINYAVTPHWIIGADYIHYDLDRTTVTSVNLPVTTPATTISASQVVAGNILRAVVNYKF